MGNHPVLRMGGQKPSQVASPTIIEGVEFNWRNATLPDKTGVWEVRLSGKMINIAQRFVVQWPERAWIVNVPEKLAYESREEGAIMAAKIKTLQSTLWGLIPDEIRRAMLRGVLLLDAVRQLPEIKAELDLAAALPESVREKLVTGAPFHDALRGYQVVERVEVPAPAPVPVEGRLVPLAPPLPPEIAEATPQSDKTRLMASLERWGPAPKIARAVIIIQELGPDWQPTFQSLNHKFRSKKYKRFRLPSVNQKQLNALVVLAKL